MRVVNTFIHVFLVQRSRVFDKMNVLRTMKADVFHVALLLVRPVNLSISFFLWLFLRGKKHTITTDSGEELDDRDELGG